MRKEKLYDNKIANDNNYSGDIAPLFVMIKNIIKAIRGIYYYFLIKKRYKINKNDYFILCSMPSITYTFYACTYLKEFLQYYGGNKAIIGVTRSSHKLVTEMFPEEVRETVIINEDMALCIEKAMGLIKFEYRVALASPFGPDFNTAANILGYKDYNLKDIYKSCVYRIDPKTKENLPKFKHDSNKIEELNKIYKPNGEKLVLLIPYADLTPNLSEDFWDRVVEALSNKGYSVCTGVFSDLENPIKGTQSVFLRLSEIPDVSEVFDNIICSRSGLSDLLVYTKANVTIVYPNYKMKRGNVYSIFGFYDSNITCNLQEIIIDEDKYQTIIKKILNHIV